MLNGLATEIYQNSTFVAETATSAEQVAPPLRADMIGIHRSGAWGSLD